MTPTPEDRQLAHKIMMHGADCQKRGVFSSMDTDECAALLAEAREAQHKASWLPDLHPDTNALVDRFAKAMKEKLLKAQQKYNYGAHWATTDWEDECRDNLKQHIGKGDPLDVANYCAFMWHHGWPTVEPKPEWLVKRLERDALIKQHGIHEFNRGPQHDSWGWQGCKWYYSTPEDALDAKLKEESLPTPPITNETKE